MSFFEDAVSAILKPARKFGNIVAQVVIAEGHIDDADITQHPTESGPITDHVVLLPSRLLVRMGFTDYGLQTPATYLSEGLNGVIPPFPASSAKIYKNLLTMMRKRIPFKVVTGKRTYNNMVIKTLQVETEDKTENCLIINAYCQEVFLVQAQIVTIPPNDLHADSSLSGSPLNYGTKILASAPATVISP